MLRDGNCLFSAVAVQLDNLGIQPGKSTPTSNQLTLFKQSPYIDLYIAFCVGHYSLQHVFCCIMLTFTFAPTS